jgi:disulfide bond formation protein DsbB
MELAWRDHHHAREQTWKAIQIEAVLGAGLVTVAAQFKNNPYAIGAAAILVFFAAIFGMAISLHHRELERRKFAHILNCEEYLGLHRDDLIPVKKGLKIPVETDVAEVGIPGKFSIWAVFNPLQKMNTAIFILRMHIAIACFALIFLIYVFWPFLVHVFWQWL